MRISDWSSDVCSSDLHVLGDQLDVDGCEIKLKIASYVDLPFKIGRNDGLERVLQEPSLGDKQYRPDQTDQRQQACNNSEWPTIKPFPMMRLFLAYRILMQRRCLRSLLFPIHGGKKSDTSSGFLGRPLPAS